MGIVYIASKLLKTVGFLAVRLDLDKIRIKNQIKKGVFLTKIRIPCYLCKQVHKFFFWVWSLRGFYFVVS